MSEQKSWQARISEATDAIAQKFVESISYDRRIYKQDIAGSIAHATMLAKVGLIADAERDAIIAGLKSIEADIESGNFVFDESLEDIHMVVEDALIKRIGEPGKKLHTGRSRNDQVATDFSLWIGVAVEEIKEQLRLLNKAFVKLADQSGGIVMPSFTHLQRAQPIFAGAEALAWATMFGFDKDRLGIARPREMPLGSGAIAGSSLPIDAEFTLTQCFIERPQDDEFAGSVLTGFHSVASNSIERTASRDQACDLLYALAMISQHLSRWAEQWIIYMTTEFGFIKIADRYTTSSSMMPQKRNPDMLELIRGRCGNVYGDLFALMTILKGLPIGYNRDLQEDKRIVFRAYDTVSSCLTMAAAEYLVTKGVPFRTAHHIVGTLVARCEKEGKHSLGQLGVDSFNEVIAASTKSQGASTLGVRVDEEVYTCLGAKNVVKRYQSAGAAGGKPFEDQLAAWKKRLGI
jgi:argininosuccinate lyase